jgi:hypothetical protein
MIKLVLVLSSLFFSTILFAKEVRLDCYENSYGIESELNLDTEFNYYSTAEMFGTRTGYRTFLDLRRTSFFCDSLEYCFEGRDRLYQYTFKIPKAIFGAQRNIMTTAFLDLKSLRQPRRDLLLMTCRTR